jgi:hypothetical protein
VLCHGLKIEGELGDSEKSHQALLRSLCQFYGDWIDCESKPCEDEFQSSVQNRVLGSELRSQKINRVPELVMMTQSLQDVILYEGGNTTDQVRKGMKCIHEALLFCTDMDNLEKIPDEVFGDSLNNIKQMRKLTMKVIQDIKNAECKALNHWYSSVQHFIDPFPILKKTVYLLSKVVMLRSDWNMESNSAK